ncbi:MAG TPA: 1-acyl-sn-glycerol-3-phosphate acyltransferase [Syntrophomonadaceae bacterium]|nr:1-acyl-sn-glycerol-3-phosphate acyltransferase [Syntrophomonadaceae bacterium]
MYYWLAGWRTTGTIPAEIKKAIIVAAPHTSNIDFPLARAFFYIKKTHVNYVIKKEWMKFMLGKFFHATGALPVDRANAANMVEHMAGLLKNAEKMFIMISPEGTRSSVKKWKSGFYRTAVMAEVPLILAYLDYGKKEAGIGPVFYPTGDYEADMKYIKNYYSRIVARHPEQYLNMA